MKLPEAAPREAHGVAEHDPPRVAEHDPPRVAEHVIDRPAPDGADRDSPPDLPAAAGVHHHRHHHRRRRRRRVLPRVRMRFAWWQLWLVLGCLLLCWGLLRALKPWRVQVAMPPPTESLTGP